MIWVICMFIAGSCNAVMDIIKDLWEDSIFTLKPFFDKNETNLNKKYWWHPEGWKNKYEGRIKGNPIRKLFWKIELPVQISDGWHHFKMWMIVFVCISIVTYTPVIGTYIDFFVGGLSFVTGFNLFYNIILKRKTYARFNNSSSI